MGGWVELNGTGKYSRGVIRDPVLPDDVGCTATHIQIVPGLFSVRTQEVHMVPAESDPPRSLRARLDHWRLTYQSGNGAGVFSGRERLKIVLSLVPQSEVFWFLMAALACKWRVG